MGVIKKQSILNTIVVYTGIVIGFVNLLYVQPVFLAPEEIGLTRVLYSFSSILSVLMPLGAANIIIRYFPQYRNDDNGHNGLLGFAFLYAFIGFLFFSTLLYLTRDFISAQYVAQSRLFADNFWLVFPLCFYLTFTQLLNVYSFSLFNSVVPSIISEILMRLLNIAIILLYHFGVFNFNQFIFSFTAIYAIDLLLMVIYIAALNRPKLRFKFSEFDRPTRKIMFRFGVGLTVAAIASLGLKSVDMIILAKYVDLKKAGIYSIALFIGLFIETPLNSLDRIAGTRMAAALAHNNKKEIYDIYHKSSSYLFLIGGFLFLGVNACITPLLEFLPPAYRGNELIVLIISLGALCNMASGSNTSIIFNSKHHFKGTLLLAFVFLLFVGLLFLLVPVYGAIGAAMAIAFGTLSYNFGKFLFIKKYFEMQPFDSGSLKLAMVILAIFGISRALPIVFSQPFFEMFYRGAVVTILYGVLAIALKLVPDELLKPVRKYLPV